MKDLSSDKFSGYQKFVVAMLAFLQFTIILDFMILSPLGAMLMPALKVSTDQFGQIVSAYAFSAGAAGLLAAGFADRFDRKRLLLVFYVGFIIGTLLCGLAKTYEFLLFARIVTGLFGGVIGSVVLAITADLFPLSMRGRVMGFIQSAFAGSQILGLPIGLYFANRFDWHAPFLMIVGVGLAVGAVIFARLRPIDAHLQKRKADKPFAHLAKTVLNKEYLFAFGATALLSLGGWMLMPFGSTFTVRNMRIPIESLPTIYLISGLCSMVIGPAVGRLSDRFGKFNTFAFGSILGSAVVLYYTNLGPTPLWLAIVVNATMFLGIFSRMIPAQALMSAIPDQASRGSFMAISSSIQQIAGGVASMIAGKIVTQAAEDAPLVGFDKLGYILVGTSVVSFVMMRLISQRVARKTAPAASPAAA